MEVETFNGKFYCSHDRRFNIVPGIGFPLLDKPHQPFMILFATFTIAHFRDVALHFFDLSVMLRSCFFLLAYTTHVKGP